MKTLRNVIVSLLLCLYSQSLYGSYGGGTGTLANPYIISTAQHLVDLSNTTADWSSGNHFSMTSDIDLSSHSNIVIGHGTPFNATFDGNGNTISGYSYSGTGSVVGLFGVVGDRTGPTGGTIKNIILDTPSVTMTNFTSTSYDTFGSLIGNLDYGTVSGCTVIDPTVSISPTIATGGSNIGGFCGNSNGNITECVALNVAVTVNDAVAHAGAFSGYIEPDAVTTRCFVTGKLEYQQKATFVGGGFTGVGKGDYYDCYTRADVTHIGATGNHSQVVGGFIGHAANIYFVNRCYASGTISASSQGSNAIGGFFGDFLSGGYFDCFWDSTKNSGLTDSGDTNDGTNGDLSEVFGETTTNMQTESTFTNNGWDFVVETTNGTNDYWSIVSAGNDYPILVGVGEPLDGDLNGDWDVDKDDLEIFFDAYEKHSKNSSDPNIDWNADVDGDNDIDRDDWWAMYIDIQPYNLISDAFVDNTNPLTLNHNQYVDNNLKLDWNTATPASSATVSSGGHIYWYRPAHFSSTTVNDGIVALTDIGHDATMTVTGGVLLDRVLLHDRSKITVTGGDVDMIWARSGSKSTIDIQGGTINDWVRSDTEGIVLISGGTLNHYIWLFNDSRAFISGGDINHVMIPEGNSEYMLTGGTFVDAGSGNAADIRGNSTVWVFGSNFTIDSTSYGPSSHTFTVGQTITLKGKLVNNSSDLGVGTPANGIKLVFRSTSARLIIADGSWESTWTDLDHATGDADGDNVIDCDDKTIIDAAMGYSYPNVNYDYRADFDHDLDVDSNDETIWDNTYTGTCP